MKKTRIIGMVFATLCAGALSAFAATPALAVNLFLLDGDIITEKVPVTIETEELLLEDMGAPGKPDLLCSLTWEGEFESSKKGDIESVLMLNGELLKATALNLHGEDAEGDDIECESDNGTCVNPVLLVVMELPWLLVSDFSDPEHEPVKEPTLTVVCKTTLGLTVEDICHGGIGAFPVNEPDGVLLEFDEDEPVTTPPLHCSLSNEESGLLVGDILIRATDEEDGLLTVSPEE